MSRYDEFFDNVRDYATGGMVVLQATPSAADVFGAVSWHRDGPTADLNDLDNEILASLQEGRATPTLIKRILEQEGTREEVSRQYVNQRLKRLTEHGHVNNTLNTGVYELVNDPRENEFE